MVTIDDYGNFETAWCPGCGNFAILDTVKRALVASKLQPQQVLFVSGIGQAAKAPHYLRAHVFNGLHGRALPVATGAKLANPKLTVIVESGDGCTYGEGGNHFLAAIRRNIGITLLVHNNQVYGLTKGQASPTTQEDFVTKAQPQGVKSAPFNPLAVAVAMEANFVARSFAGNQEHLLETIVAALAHPGFALVDILQPCVSYNRINTYAWYSHRCQPLGPEHDPRDWEAAMRAARQWGERIPIGVIFKNDRPPFEERLGVTPHGLVESQAVDSPAWRQLLDRFA